MQIVKMELAAHDQPQAHLTAGIVSTSLGPMLMLASSQGIHHLQFGDSAGQLDRELRSRFPHAFPSIDRTSQQWLDAVVQAIESPQRRSPVPLIVSGTPFQQLVWDALCEIPVGDTLSYRQLASRVGKPAAVRAVAGACAANQIAVLIPCHRVVRSDGGLGGYRWGVERKKNLLALEASATRNGGTTDGASLTPSG